MLAQGRLKDWGPLLVIWGGAMLVLVETNDLGSALLYYGIFLGDALRGDRRGSLRRARARASSPPARTAPTTSSAHVRDRVTIWLHPWTSAAGALRADGPAGAAAGLRELPARQVALLDRERRLRRHRLRQGHLHDAEGGAADPVPEHGLHLLRARAGARPRRRRRAAARLHALRRARDAGRAARRRRLLEAARRRAHVRLRAADVHHRRRRPAADPADRDHAAVRLLRRLEHRRELRAARGPPARLQPRQRGRRR